MGVYFDILRGVWSIAQKKLNNISKMYIVKTLAQYPHKLTPDHTPQKISKYTRILFYELLFYSYGHFVF